MWGDAAVVADHVCAQAVWEDHSMDRDEILGKYTMASTVEDLIEVYTPLVTELDADYVAIQIASTNPVRTLEIVEKEVLPELRSLAVS